MKTNNWPALLDVELRRLGMRLAANAVDVGGHMIVLRERTLVVFFRKIEARAGRCWEWRGVRDRDGYGTFHVRCIDASCEVSTTARAHRISYQVLKGSIAEGLTLDHLCRIKRCVNPGHLDPCASGENVARSPDTLASINRRKVTCPQGHFYDMFLPSQSGTITWRSCRECRRRAQRDYARRRRAGDIR